MDGNPQSPGSLDRSAQNTIDLQERVKSLQQQGRLLHLQGLEAMIAASSSAKATTAQTEHPRNGDVWDEIIEQISQRRSRRQAQWISGQVASRIQAHWDAVALKQDKARAQEERRLKTLAKATLKMVMAEWKKVVFVCTLCIGALDAN
jgi:helicase SWR1